MGRALPLDQGRLRGSLQITGPLVSGHRVLRRRREHLRRILVAGGRCTPTIPGELFIF